jgi:triphosphoribosyl-dephospho-CoA synthetase
LRQLTVEVRRAPASIRLSYRVKRYGEAMLDKASDGERRLFSGGTTDIVDDLEALRELGVAAIG